jgi:hypothetical protein
VGDRVEALERAWVRYRDRVETLAKESTDDDRAKIVTALAKHAKLIEKMGGSLTLKGGYGEVDQAAEVVALSPRS